MRWITITQTTMVVIFNLQNSHLLTLSLPTGEVFQVNGQNWPVKNSFSAERTANTKAAEYVTQWISQQPPKSSEFSVSRHIYRKANPPHHRSLPFSVSGQHWNQSLAPFFLSWRCGFLFYILLLSQEEAGI